MNLKYIVAIIIGASAVTVIRGHLGRILYVPAKISVNLDLLTDMTFCKLNASFALCNRHFQHQSPTILA